MIRTRRLWHTGGLYAVALVTLSACAALGPGDSDRPTFTTQPDAIHMPDESPSTPTPEPEAKSAGPGPTTHFLDPWEITVLSTDRDAGRTLGQGNHPDDFPQVMTTISLTNTGTSVRDQTMLEFTFADPGGTQNGYNPWDDWCASHPLDYAASPWYVLPGQTKVVTVCVPVNPRDADGLTMWVVDGDPADLDAKEIQIPLTKEGEEWDAPAESNYAALHQDLASRTQRTGTAFGYEFSIADVSVSAEGDGLANVAITLDAKFLEHDTSREAFVDVEILGPSGTQEPAQRCDTSTYVPTLEGESWQYDYCVSVPQEDAHSLLLVLAQWYTAPNSLTLNAYTD